MYSKPVNGGIGTEIEDDDDDSKYDAGFGVVGKQKGKKNTKSNDDAAKEAQLKRLAEIK
jgi:hypothetical protein